MRSGILRYAPRVSGTARAPSSTARSDSDRYGSRIPVAPLLATASAAVVYAFLALRRVWELQANAFDAGFLDNVLYKVSSGLGDVSGLTGVPHFVDHASALLFFAIPLYWVNVDIAYETLLVLQAVSVAMVGLAAWLIAEALSLSRRKRALVLVFVLASPAAYWAIITELHLTGLTMGLVAMTVAGAYRRWRLSVYWIMPLLASLARVEIAVTVVVAGLLLLGVSRAHARVTIAIGSTVTVALALFMLLVPDQGSSVGAHFDYLGIESFSELPLAALKQPGAVLEQVFDPVLLTSVLMWLVVVGVVLPMRASRWFLIGAPMLLVAVVGSPLYADVWFQHYWNFLLVGAAVAFAVSLTVWSFSDRMATALVVVVLLVAWVIPGSLFLRPRVDVVYAPTSLAKQHAAAIASSTPGALSTFSKLVPPAAHREWVYNFPNPFVCHAHQYAHFALAGPAPDVVITQLGWEDTVGEEDIATIRDTLTTHYAVTDRIGQYTVRALLPGGSPPLVQECQVVPSDE